MSVDAIENTNSANQEVGNYVSNASSQNVQQACRENRNLIPAAQDCGQAAIMGVSAISPPIP
jgi:hypothetical protein